MTRFRAFAAIAAAFMCIAASLSALTPIAAAQSANAPASDACGSFAGTVTWHGWEYHSYLWGYLRIPENPHIQIQGTLSSKCSGETSVWLSFDSLGITSASGLLGSIPLPVPGSIYHNIEVANVTGKASTTLNPPAGFNLKTNPSSIGVAVCTSENGWHCGPTTHM